jgi:hypothetical protein
MFEAGNVAHWWFYSIFFQLCGPRQRPRKGRRLSEEGKAPTEGETISNILRRFTRDGRMTIGRQYNMPGSISLDGIAPLESVALCISRLHAAR